MLPLLLPLWLVIIGIMAILAAGCVVGFFLGESHRKKVAEAKIGSAEEEARRLVNDAVKTAQQKRKEALVEAKDAALQMKTEADKEIKERRNELSRQERRLDQKEEALDKKVSAMEQKEEDLRKRQELAEARLSEVEQLRLREMEKLETIAGLSTEDAKQLLLSKLDEQLAHEKAMHIAAYETQTKDEAETMARELISQAIARCAADHSSEATVSVVALPSDEMKGRIIGRTHTIRFQVGLVFQYPEYQLFEETVYKDIAFGPRNMKLDEGEIDRRVRRAAAFAGLRDEVLSRSPFELSGGQKRRVAIAGVIAMEPKVLILDEPTAGLDPAGAASILANIETYRQANHATVILVSHSMEDVARLADRLVVVSQGTLPYVGTPREVFSHGEALESMGLAVPAMNRVFSRVRAMGVDIDPAVYTVEQAKAAILDALRKKGGR